MGVIQSGAVTTDLLTVDRTFKAARVTWRPPECTGAYKIGLKTGTIAAGTAAGIMGAFRYTGSAVCVVTAIKAGLNVLTGYTAGSIVFSIWNTRNYTATETTNYTAANVSADNQNMRTSHSAPAVAVGMGTTTGATGGTGTDDSQALASVIFALPASISGQAIQDFFTFHTHSHPLVLVNNEGFRLRNDTAFAATGTANVVMNVEWFEVAAY